MSLSHPLSIVKYLHMWFVFHYNILSKHISYPFTFTFQDNYNVLHIAAMYSREDVVKLLLNKRGVDPFSTGGVSRWFLAIFPRLQLQSMHCYCCCSYCRPQGPWRVDLALESVLLSILR